MRSNGIASHRKAMAKHCSAQQRNGEAKQGKGMARQSNGEAKQGKGVELYSYAKVENCTVLRSSLSQKFI